MSKSQIIVTGASRGIGEAIALELDRRGFAVAGFSRSGASAAGIGYACDMTDEAAIAAAIANVAASGPIMGLVNNAGAHEGKRSAELSLAEFETTMRLNASAVMVSCREVYPHLKAKGDGLIVNIGSFCKLGLGYPDGPIERVVRGGLARHFQVTQALFETYGTPSYAPPRRAVVASRRK